VGLDAKVIYDLPGDGYRCRGIIVRSQAGLPMPVTEYVPADAGKPSARKRPALIMIPAHHTGRNSKDLVVLGANFARAGGVALAGGKGLPPWLLLSCPPLLAVALGVPLLIRFRPAGLWRMLTRILPGKAKELAEVRLTGRQFGGFFLVSLLSEIISVLTVYFCLRAYTQIDLLTACAVAPLVMLHNVIPATPGGFGVREALAVAIMVDLLALPGLTAPQVLAAYLTNPIMVLVIPGAVGIVAAWLAGMMRSLDAEAAP